MTADIFKEIRSFVSDLGFPIFIAIWVLVVHKKTIESLTEAITSLTRSFDRANIDCSQTKKGGD